LIAALYIESTALWRLGNLKICNPELTGKNEKIMFFVTLAVHQTQTILTGRVDLTVGME